MAVMREKPELHSHWISEDGDEGACGQASALFPYWSFTKTAIAIIALKLFERGLITLDDRLEDKPYTLRQLLGHTAGIADYTSLREYRQAVQNDEEPWPQDVLLKRVEAKGALFAPGCGWSYSNTGYMLARNHIEARSGQDFSAMFNELIHIPLGLKTVSLATSRADFAPVHWTAARHYHPGWVYHGCLMGSARDAVLILHALFCGQLLQPATLTQMLSHHPLGGAIEGRPWTQCGYGLGVMSGRVGEAGRAIGHSGGGPFCVNAVYHFPDRDCPVTVASFTDGHNEGVAEFEATRISSLKARAGKI